MESRHEEFQARHLWSLFDSFTEAAEGSLNELPRRTQRLRGLMDAFVEPN